MRPDLPELGFTSLSSAMRMRLALLLVLFLSAVYLFAGACLSGVTLTTNRVSAGAGGPRQRISLI